MSNNFQTKEAVIEYDHNMGKSGFRGGTVLV